MCDGYPWKNEQGKVKPPELYLNATTLVHWPRYFSFLAWVLGGPSQIYNGLIMNKYKVLGIMYLHLNVTFVIFRLLLSDVCMFCGLIRTR